MNDHARRMDLDLEVDDLDISALVSPGRRAEPLTAVVSRPLRQSDLAILATSRSIQPVELKKMSERHHGLARLIASGASEHEAGLIMGYQPSRVSILKGDPAFRELISFYREKVDIEFADTMSQLSGLSKDLLLELRERLEEDPGKFSNKEIRELLTTTLDRSGHGPTSKQLNVNLDLSGKLEAARQRKLNLLREEAQMKDVTPDEPDES